MPGALGQSPPVLHPIALHSVASVGQSCAARPCYEAPPLTCIVLPLYWISQYVGLHCSLAAGHCFTLHCVRLACIRTVRRSVMASFLPLPHFPLGLA